MTIAEVLRRLAEGFIGFWKIPLLFLPDGTEIGLWIIPAIFAAVLGVVGGKRLLKKL